MEFPTNSRKAAVVDQENQRVERVTSSAVRRRSPLGRSFKRTFFSGDARTALDYMIGSVVVPSIQEMMLDAFQAGMERLVRGESRPSRGAFAPKAGPLGFVSYNSVSRGGRQQNIAPAALSRAARGRNNFGDIVIQTRSEAEDVLDRMFDLLERHDSVRVADLYKLTGLPSAHTDFKWGWEQLRGASVDRVRGGGYVLNLPEPEPLG